jgi:hypothetical protein
MYTVKYHTRRGEELSESESLKYLPYLALPDYKLVVMANRTEFTSG